MQQQQSHLKDGFDDCHAELDSASRMIQMQAQDCGLKPQ
jgi:hypothetical protein